MKHSIKITLLLLSLFFLTQLIGLLVINAYSPEYKEVTENGITKQVPVYNLPYGVNPPESLTPKESLISLLVSVAFAVCLMLMLMKFRAESLLKFWFFMVVTFALGITINAFMQPISYAPLLALVIALPITYFKIIKRNIIIHNLSEMLIYPGIAVILVPLLSLATVSILLIVISLYDMYAVWHAGFMQKMAKYQIQKLRVFSGFLVPYLGKKERELVQQARANKNMKSLKNKKIKMSIALLGGGDVVFPIITAGVIFNLWGLIPALMVTAGATLALALLFYFSEKGKFYPAMPFIAAGCFVGLAVGALL